MGLDWSYSAKRWVFSGPTSYAMEYFGWYWEKKGKTLRDVAPQFHVQVPQECKNLNWPSQDLGGDLALLMPYVPVGIKEIKKKICKFNVEDDLFKFKQNLKYTLKSF